MNAPIPLLSPESQKLLLAFSRKILEGSLDGKAGDILAAFQKTHPHRPDFTSLSPCFVSLHTGTKRLRGCMGSLETSHTLIENVSQYTQIAAFSDPRFPPVEESEFKNLKVSITVLGPLKPLTDVEKLVVGKEGLFIQKGTRRGVLLAQVAVEQGWDLTTFVDQTCSKAGLRREDLPGASLFHFEEQSFSE